METPVIEHLSIRQYFMNYHITGRWDSKRVSNTRDQHSKQVEMLKCKNGEKTSKIDFVKCLKLTKNANEIV